MITNKTRVILPHVEKYLRTMFEMHDEWVQTQKNADAAIAQAREQKRQHENACEYLSRLVKETPQNKDEIADQMKYINMIVVKYREALQDIVANREKIRYLVSKSFVEAKKHLLLSKL